MISKKKLAAEILNTSPGKIRIADGALEDVAKAITRSDIRGLIAIGKIYEDKQNYRSRAGARKNKAQKRKGRRSGMGSRKGSKHSIVSRKEKWILRIRVQRKFLHDLKQKGRLSPEHYYLLYSKSKGGYFRSVRHIKLYITEQQLIKKTKSKMLAK